MPKKPVSKNLARLNEDMRRELISIIGTMKDPRLKTGLLTITKVDTTNDLSQSRVFISVMDEAGGRRADEKNTSTADVVAALNAAKGHVRSEIASRMHIRRAPEFIFFEDDNAAYAAHINEMLRGL